MMNSRHSNLIAGDSAQHAVWSTPRVLGGLAAATAIALLIVACITWAAPHIARLRIQRPIVASIEAAGGAAYFDYQVSGGSIKPQAPPPGPSFVRALFGDDVFATVNVVMFWEPTVTDGDVSSLPELTELKDVVLTGPRITDGCIDALLQIQQLRGLNLSNTAISPNGLSKLAASPRLQALTLYGSSVTDSHLAELANFSCLHHLQIIRSPVTDQGVVSLGRIHGLQSLDICSSDIVTDEGIAGLKQLTDLESLEIIGTSLTDESLATIGDLPRLRHLRLWGQFSDKGVAEFQAKLPRCHIVCIDPDADDEEAKP